MRTLWVLCLLFGCFYFFLQKQSVEIVEGRKEQQGKESQNPTIQARGPEQNPNGLWHAAFSKTKGRLTEGLSDTNPWLRVSSHTFGLLCLRAGTT